MNDHDHCDVCDNDRSPHDVPRWDACAHIGAAEEALQRRAAVLDDLRCKAYVVRVYRFDAHSWHNGRAEQPFEIDKCEIHAESVDELRNSGYAEPHRSWEKPVRVHVLKGTDPAVAANLLRKIADGVADNSLLGQARRQGGIEDWPPRPQEPGEPSF